MNGRIPVGHGDAAMVTYSWDEVVSGSGASVGDHTRDRKAQGCKTAKASGWELSLTNVRGVKLKSVTVVMSLFKTRPESQ